MLTKSCFSGALGGFLISVAAATSALGQAAVWTAQGADPSGLVTASVVEGGEQVAAFVCLRQSSPPVHIYQHDHWVLVISPRVMGADLSQSDQATVNFSLDGQPFGQTSMIMTRPEGNLAALVPLDGPVTDRLMAAQVLGLSGASQTSERHVSLAGFAQALRAARDACTSQATAEAPPAAPVVEAAATPVPAPAPVSAQISPGQTWYGPVSCKVRRKHVEAEFSITEIDANGIVKARLLVGDEASLSEGTNRIALLGEPAEGGEYRFVVASGGTAQIGGSARFSEFRFRASDGVGTFDTGACSDMQLSVVTADSPRMAVQAAAPLGGGLFHLAQTDRARCEVLLAWAGRLNEEYPKIDFFRTASNAALSRKKITIFGDPDFVPVFGQAYDRLTYEERAAISQFARGTCASDPFIRNRTETFRSAADRPMTGGSARQELTSDGYSATVLAVRRMRELRAAVSAGTSAAPATGNVAAQLAHLERMRATLQEELDTLWPSERKGMIEKLDLAIAGIGQSEVTTRLAPLLAIRDPAQAIAAVDKLLAELAGSSAPKVPASFLRDTRSQLATVRAQAVEAILTSEITRLGQIPQGLDGARTLLDERRKSTGALAALTQAERGPYDTALREAVDSRLDRVLQLRLQDLEQRATVQDLAADAAWIADFDADFAAFKDFASVTAAREQFRRHRGGRLLALLAEFQAELDQQPDDDSRQVVFERYLNWQGDSSLPVYLEYQLLMP